MPTIRPGSLRYDAASGFFEARVDVQRNGRTYRYPARVAAPQGADMAWVAAALARNALGMSDSR